MQITARKMVSPPLTSAVALNSNSLFSSHVGWSLGLGSVVWCCWPEDVGPRMVVWGSFLSQVIHQTSTVSWEDAGWSWPRHDWMIVSLSLRVYQKLVPLEKHSRTLQAQGLDTHSNLCNVLLVKEQVIEPAQSV